MPAFLALLLLSTSLPSFAGWFSKSEEETFEEDVTKSHISNKQSIVEEFHLLATAKELEVQEFQLIDTQGKPTDSLKTAAGYAIVFTIFWKSDLRSDGYTKVFRVYDGSVRNFVNTQVIATNGVLNQDVTRSFGEILGALIGSPR